MRDAPLLTALEQLAPHDHLCAIYESSEEQLAVAIPFIRIGLERGEKCIYIADDGTEAVVRDAMGAEGIDVERAIATDSLVLSEKEATYLKNGSFDPEWMFTFWGDSTAEATSQGFSALRVTGETEWLLRGGTGLERWAEYESLLTRILAQHNCLALCQYNGKLAPPELVLDIIRTHPTLIYRGVVYRNMYHVPPDELLGTNQTAREVERLLTNIRERQEVEHTLLQQRDELRQRVRQQEAVAQLGQAALRGGPLSELFGEALHLITSTCSVEFAEIAELCSDEMLLLRAALGWKEGLVGHARLPAGSGSQCAFTLLSGAPSVVEDFSSESRFEVDPLIREQGMTSGVTVLIQGAGPPYGTLGMHSKDRRAFTREDITFLQAAANVLAATIERERAEDESRGQREQLAALSRRLIEAQEAERRSIARELHDDFGQVLTALRLNLQKNGADPGESIELVDQAIGRMRDLALDLRPAILDDLGLAPALRWYGAREAKRAGLDFRLSIAELDERLPPPVEITCFRLVQEALTNVVRHAQARSVTVTLTTLQDEVRLDVSDDGWGFELAEARRRAAAGTSQGLIGMQERVSLAGGELAIDTAPGRGTTIRARFPRSGRGGT